MKYYYLKYLHLAMSKIDIYHELITFGKTSTSIEYINSHEPPCIPYKNEEITKAQFDRLKKLAELRIENHILKSNQS